MKFNKNNSLLRPGPILRKRYRRDNLLKYTGMSAIILSIIFLVCLICSIFISAYPSFFRSEIRISIILPNEFYSDKEYHISRDEMVSIIKDSINTELQGHISSDSIIKLLNQDAISALVRRINKDENVDSVQKIKLPMIMDVNLYLSGNNHHKLSNNDLLSIKCLLKKRILKKVINYGFITGKESTYPEIAGLFGSIMASIYTIFIAIMIALPISIMTAIYLEEFAPRNKLTNFIEININNLAAIPSIVFGLIGLAIFINFLEVPRSSSLAGGFTLSLMALPSIIITTRQAIRSVPLSIKNGFMALGASKIQGIFHHILPLSLPGIMTGTILATSRIFGETAPLMMIGMVAFISDVPKSFTDAASPLPVQIYLWAQNPEYGFVSKTSAAIIILLFILIAINMLAVFIRKKYEHRW